MYGLINRCEVEIFVEVSFNMDEYYSPKDYSVNQLLHILDDTTIKMIEWDTLRNVGKYLVYPGGALTFNYHDKDSIGFDFHKLTVIRNTDSLFFNSLEDILDEFEITHGGRVSSITIHDSDFK